MPRKNKGVRKCHVKSRNGCVQCKRRRVKCDVKQPICSSCSRRGEDCQYPDMFGNSYYQSLQASWPQMLSARPANILHPTSHTEFEILEQVDGQLTAIQPAAGPKPDYTGLKIMSIGIIRLVMERANMPPGETVLWANSMAEICVEKDYIMHTVMSLACGLQDVLSRPDKMVGDKAYEHNIKASSLFRQQTEVIDSSNWLPPIMFHVLTVVFRLYSQAFCAPEDFSLVDTLRLFKSGMAIVRQTTGFVMKSPFWEFIVARTGLQTKLNTDNEPFLYESLGFLESVLSGEEENPFATEEQQYQARVHRQGLGALYGWIEHCDALPRSWPHYCGWPSLLSDEFLDLVEQKNEFALLLVIHWCGLLYRSNKPGVKAWAYRAGHDALSGIQHPEWWSDALDWPLKMLLPLW
ncbi:unnamed protein product [Periconia digitata]|uniref:Zn(2)-C6 fungal-type domain-containing protein n=1 Tax=Periconia digitata TaxID=1303443 RepID=A0A9W4UW21_9PLEO|nr:unnamed protein product [Periconia digitata]